MKNNIIESKIQIPRVSKNFIERQRLLKQFQEDLKLFILHATVGYGKTVLLTQLSGKSEAAWYHLNESDNDVITFMQYLSRSLEKIYGSLQFNLEKYEGMEQNESQLTEMAYDLLKQIIAAQKKEKDTYLIFDDFQVINNEKIDTVLEIFISNMRPDLKVIIATKGSIPRFWSRFYLQGQSILIDQEQLGFNEQEIRIILEQMVDKDKDSEETVSRLYKSVEGWPAGVMFEILYLKQGGLRSSKNIMGKAAVYDYIMRALYRKLPFDIQTFLAETSVLEFLNADVCNAVMRIDNSENILNYLVQENLLIIKVGDGDKMFRYHSLMKEFLNEQLNEQTRKEIMRRSAEFYLHTDNKELAVEYAINSQNMDIAEYTVGSIGIDMVNQGKLSTVKRWIDWIDAQHINISPKTMMVYGVYNCKAGCVNKGLNYLNSAVEKFISSMNEVGYIQAILVKAKMTKLMGMEEETENLIDELKPILVNKDREKMVLDFCIENQIKFNTDLQIKSKRLEDEKLKDNEQIQNNDKKSGKSKVYIKAFGDFKLFIDGTEQELKWRTKKAQELLGYLFHLAGEPVSKENLIMLLWPENQEKSATSLLHTALYSVRKELVRYGLDNLITYNNRKYVLNTSMIESDVQKLTMCYKSLGTDGKCQLEEEKINEIYTGSYMEKLELDDFLPQRVYYEKMYLKICETAGTEAFEKREYQRCITWMDRAIAVDPFEESFHALRIKSYAAKKDLKNTKKYYEKLKEMLFKEFNLKPSKDINESIKAIWSNYSEVNDEL